MTRIDANFGLRRRSGLLALSFALLALGCQRAADAPLRSPTKDYPLPPPQTSDGQVVGADNRPPEDRLEEGVSSGGPAPGWSVGEDGLNYDPERKPRGSKPPDAPHGTPAKSKD